MLLAPALQLLLALWYGLLLALNAQLLYLLIVQCPLALGTLPLQLQLRIVPAPIRRLQGLLLPNGLLDRRIQSRLLLLTLAPRVIARPCDGLVALAGVKAFGCRTLEPRRWPLGHDGRR